MTSIKQIIKKAKQDVFNDIDEYLIKVNNKIPWGLMASRGLEHSFKDISPTYEDIKRKHLKEVKKCVKE